MFEIRYTSEAVEDLKRLSRHDRRRIMDQIDAGLKQEPERETQTTRF